MLRWLGLTLVLIVPLSACGTKNVADCDEGRPPIPCSERTDDEKARQALDDKDWDTAIELLVRLKEDEPERYDRYPLLAAAYAGRAGFDVFGFARQSGEASGGSAVNLVNKFLPSADGSDPETYANYVGDMHLAVETLKGIPADELGSTSAADYAESALLQLSIYEASYAFMFLQQFVTPTATGLDVSRFESMTEEEAIAVIRSLEDVTALEQVPGNAAIQTQVQSALDSIDSQDGADYREKLRQYMEQHTAQQGNGGNGG